MSRRDPLRCAAAFAHSIRRHARVTADGREICPECAGKGYVGDGELCVCEGSGIMPVPGEIDAEDVAK